MFCFIDEVVLVECVCVRAKAPSLQNSFRGESQLFISVCVCVCYLSVWSHAVGGLCVGRLLGAWRALREEKSDIREREELTQLHLQEQGMGCGREARQ